MKQEKILSSIFVIITTFVFMISSVFAAQSAVNLGAADNFEVLAKSGISTIGTTSIVGDIGVSPISSPAITGFGLIMDSSNQFATSSLVMGNVYAADYTSPTPTKMTTAISDMETAYTDAAGRALPDQIDLGAGEIGGMTLVPGLYKWGTGVSISTDVTLTGTSDAVWIFQISGDLNIASGKKIILSGGAQAKNIFWQVAGTTTLETTSNFNGIILGGSGASTIALRTGATLNGKALAQKDVTLDANKIFLTDITPPSEPLKAQLTVIKHVINDDRGFKLASDFTMLVTGVAPDKTNFSGNESGTLITIEPGVYSVDEIENSGYLKTLSANCSGTIAAEESKVCIITNDDKLSILPPPPPPSPPHGVPEFTPFALLLVVVVGGLGVALLRRS